MANGRYSNFVNRMVIGKEKSENYARDSLPSNRWELFFDILKSRIGKLILINVLMLLFCLPLVATLLFRYVNIVNFGSVFPFGQGFGVGYQAPPSVAGFSEDAIFNANLVSYLFLPVALGIASVGISGGAYVIRNLVWTEGIFVANDFWKGIRQNIKSMLCIAVLYSIVFYLSVLAISYCNVVIAKKDSLTWLFYIIKTFCIIVLALFSVVGLYSISLTVTYEMKFGQLLKNSFLIIIAMPVRTLFFAFLALLPFIFFFLGDFMSGIATVLLIFISISYCLLVWTNYCQWIFDKYINDKVKGAKKNRGIYKKTAVKSDSQALQRYKDQLEYAKTSTLASRPIKPITDEELKIEELPESFSRKDIERLNQSKTALYEDNEKYIKEHLNDEQFAEIEKQRKEAEEIEQQKQKRIESAKKELLKRAKRK